MHRPRTGDAEVGYLLFLHVHKAIKVEIINATRGFLSTFMQFLLKVFMLHFPFSVIQKCDACKHGFMTDVSCVCVVCICGFYEA